MDWGLDLGEHVDLNHDGIADVHHGVLDSNHDGIDDFIQHPLGVDLDGDHISDVADSHVDLNHDGVNDLHGHILDISHPIPGSSSLGNISASLHWPDPFR